jgi:hyperosmotically inducible protein
MGDPMEGRMRACLRAGLTGLVTIAVIGGAFAGAAEDSDIARRVDDQLRRSPTVGHLGVRAKVRDGRVSLDGRVRTLAQAWQAVDLAGKVRGAIEVESRIEISSRGSGDPSIETAVKRRFEDLPEVAGAGLTVTVEAGTVTLAGKVRDARVRFTAADAAAGVEGVVAVTDRIETPELDDETIEKAVAGLFATRSLVRVTGKVESTVKDGVVTLEGYVTRLYDRKRATRLVLGINGVRAIENRLAVKPSDPNFVIPLN